MSAVAEKIVTTAWFIIVFGVSAVVVLSLLPFSPIRTVVPDIEEEKITEITPQGWGFFTKDPQERRLTIYRSEAGMGWEDFTQSNSSMDNKFGLSRFGRVRGLELGNLLESHSDKLDASWVECDSVNMDSCLESANSLTAVQIQNDYQIQTLCGSILLVQQAPNPWAYSQAGFENGNPISLLRLEVRCDD